MRYTKAVDSFFVWMDERGITMPNDPDSLDTLVSERIEDLWQEGDAKAQAGDVLSGLSHFVETVRGKLPGAWRLFTAWGKAELPSRAPPLSVDMVLGMMGYALNVGDVRFAAALALGFHCLLRSAELMGAMVGDLSLDVRRGTGVLNLGFTKGGKRRGVIEHVALNDPNIVKLLSLAVEGLDKGELICSRSPSDFHRVFRFYLQQLHFTNGGYKPYSLRRGGATYWFKKCGNMTGTCERGRWSSARTARIYINDGLLELLDIELSKAQRSRIDRGVALWKDFIL